MADAGQHGGARPCLCGWGKKDAGDQALGRSRGGFSSKLHAACDALGNPLRFSLTAGQAGDAPRALGLIDGIETEAVLADRAYDSDAILEAVKAMVAEAVIPPHPVRTIQRDTDWFLYKERHKIEVMFGYLKHFRRVFARFDKLAKRYLAFVHFAAACVLLR
jgi:transposase